MLEANSHLHSSVRKKLLKCKKWILNEFEIAAIEMPVV